MANSLPQQNYYMRLSVICESREYNILTNFDNTIQAMAEIEGYGWLEKALHHDNCRPSHECVQQALEDIKRFQDDQARYKSTPGDEWLIKDPDDDIVAIIYGSGGWNRWQVFGSGRIQLSSLHSNRETNEKAKRLGFGTSSDRL